MEQFIAHFGTDASHVIAHPDGYATITAENLTDAISISKKWFGPASNYVEVAAYADLGAFPRGELARASKHCVIWKDFH